MRTFSKAWGLAALRLGVLAGHSDVINVLNIIKMPYNINSATTELAMRALDNQAALISMVEQLAGQKQELDQKLKWMDIVEKVYPSDANFLLVRFTDSQEVFEYLKEHDVIVRNRSTQPLCAGCLRITIGSKEENHRLLELLNEIEASRKSEKDKPEA